MKHLLKCILAALQVNNCIQKYRVANANRELITQKLYQKQICNQRLKNVFILTTRICSEKWRWIFKKF